MASRDENDRTRTRMAGERTQLAWVRTGLAGIAVGVGLARVVPLLDANATAWPYEALGIAYCVFGVGLIGFGVQRGKLSSDPDPEKPAVPVSGIFLAAGGVLLGLATIAVVALAR